MASPPANTTTTLCMVIFDGGHVFYGQSGDSGILALLRSGDTSRSPVSSAMKTAASIRFAAAPTCGFSARRPRPSPP